jgi:hypothetical protein
MNNNTKRQKRLSRKEAFHAPPVDKKPKVGASAFSIMKSLGGPGAHLTHGP